MNNRDFRISPRIITIACLSRAIVLLVLIGGAIAVHVSDIVIALAARHVPTNGVAAIRAISCFIFFNHIYYVPIAVVSSLGVYYAVRYSIKEKMKNIFIIPITATSAHVSFVLCVQKIPVFFFIVYFALAAAAALLIDMRNRAFVQRFHSVKTLWRDIFVCVPFIVELIFPFELVDYLGSHRLRPHHALHRVVRAVGPLYSAAMISIVLCYVFTIVMFSRLIIPVDIAGDASHIGRGNIYGLRLDAQRDYLIAANMDSNHLEIYDVRQTVTKLFEVAIPTEELEDVSINFEKREFYNFDRGSNKLLVFDLDSFALKNTSIQSMEGHGSAGVAFDNVSKIIAVAREDDYMWIINMETLQPIRALNISEWNESMVFNTQLNAFVLSYISKYPFIQVVSPDGKSSKRVDAKLYQGGITSADRYGELFIALPLAGKIAVYDVPSLKLKRLIPTVFGVRGIAYDNIHDLLVTTSMFNGHVAILDRNSGRIRKRIFVGYWLREICLNESKREAYVSSLIGGLYSFKY